MTRLTLAAALLLAPFATAPTVAQTATPAAPALDDARWAPWLGCWRATDDRAGTGTRVCVAPARGGVSISTVAGGQRLSDETRLADGREHPVDTSDCRGTATVRWAETGTRLYRTATIACDGAAARTLTSAAFFVDGPTWIDVETVDVDGDTRVRVTRLVRAPSVTLADGTSFPRPAASAMADARTRWSVEDVIALAKVLPPDGVQAAISEAPSPFKLNARTLAALADANVGERVIDLMVGVTWPDRFVVQRVGPTSVGGGMSMDDLSMGGMMMMSDPFFASVVGPAAMYGCYSPYGWARTSYWSNCAMVDPYFYGRYPGYYSGYWGVYGPDWVNPGGVVQQPGGVIGDGGSAGGGGRLVNGRGYTQVRPIETTAPLGNGGAFTGGSGGQNAGTSSGGNSGVSSGGYSGGGGSGGGGDRTAVPRGPGGR